MTKQLLRFILFLPLLLVPGPEVQPVSNLPLCPASVHDRYTAAGPDGIRYPTWHPQIDASAHCRFDHEHGSDPALILPGYQPLYGYSAKGMAESNAGFKGYAFHLDGYGWYLTQHMGTAAADKAACVREHTLDLLVVDAVGTVLANVHMLADFGRAAANETYVTLSTTCPQPADGTTGVREFPVVSLHNIGYEPWRPDKRAIAGVNLRNITFNTSNPQTACLTLTCTVSVARNDPGIGPSLGTYRFVTVYSGFGIVATGAYSGTFTTDPIGTQPGTLQQYIAPGLDVEVVDDVALYPYNGQAYLYAPTVPGYDSMPFRLNPLVTGAN